MEKKTRVILTEGQGEYVEKKSRFIATVRICQDEKQAIDFIEEMKKKYWDARHNCSAFIVGTQSPISRCSDDGEPSGTAGRPMLEVLTGEQLTNVAVVVTRYFGGTLLGTGGLVRAYTQAVKEALLNCEIGELVEGVILELETDYNGVGKILYYLGQKQLAPLKADYTDVVVISIQIPKSQLNAVSKELTECTNGRISFLKQTECTFFEKSNA